MLREVFGNPCRPVAMEKCPRCDGDGKAHGSDRPFEWGGPGTYPGPCPVCKGFRYVRPPWLTPDVVALAHAAYEERQLPDGHLDAARLAVLADALGEAGATDAQLLGHLRGLETVPAVDGGVTKALVTVPLRGPHVRGCWALDLILGRG